MARAMISDRRALLFRCLILCTLGYVVISLLVKGSKSVTSWRTTTIHKSDGNSRPHTEDKGVTGSGANHDFNLPPSKGEKLLLKSDVTAALFTCNEYWRGRLDIDKTPKRYSCPNSKRALTMKSAYMDVDAISDADVVIFADSLTNKTIWDEVIRRRKSHQLWVYSTTESPYYSPQILNDVGRPIGFGNFRFNASFGYHSFSSVVAPFGEYRPSLTIRRKMDSKSVDYFKRKPRLVSWVSSHCIGQFWNRTEFVRSLSKLIPVDMYGACGERKLRRGPLGREKLTEYKFNLALENSCCLEYISEKLWNPLAYFQSVPVVLGPSRSDYERVAPPNSFIFAEDFQSLEDLSRYLQKLARNATLYNQFHEWRRHGDVSVYNNIRVFPFTSEESACALLDFVEKVVQVNETKELITFDPFDSEFLGSCRACGKYEWLRKFNTNPDPYNPTPRSEEHHNN